jgi:2-polyprenyl-6-methoxyphenol hydroxylase-like FAD-dependent oxidoreductase
VFADGYRSAGRRLVAPEAAVAYRGLVVWRGLVPEHAVDVADLEGARTRIMYPGGHGVVRLVPGASGRTAVGERLVEWAFCLPVPAAEVRTALTGVGGRRYPCAVPFGQVDPAVAAALRARLAPVLPAVHLDLVDRCAATSLQAIVSVDVERPHRARACLVGDAASVFPPFTGSGVLKAVDDAMTLRAALDGAGSVRAALAAWGAQQRRLADTVREIAHRNERELVERVPDLAAMGTAEKSQWLAALHRGDELRLPEEPQAPAEERPEPVDVASPSVA